MHNDHIISPHVFNSMVKPNSVEIESENVIGGCDIDHVPYHQEAGTAQGDPIPDLQNCMPLGS